MYQKTQYTDQLTFSPEYTATLLQMSGLSSFLNPITWFYNSYFCYQAPKPEIFHSAGKAANHVSTTRLVT